MIYIYEKVPLSYITYVVEKSRHTELHVAHLDQFILRAVRNNSIGVTSDGLWADFAVDTQITLTHRRDVR